MDNPIVLMVILLGGFAASLLIAIAAMFPWLKRVPQRWAVIIAGVIPSAVLASMMLADLVVIGRQPKVLAAMSPMVLALALPCLSFITSCRKSGLQTRSRVVGMCLSFVLILVVLWSTLILWVMTDRDFMGAGC